MTTVSNEPTVGVVGTEQSALLLGAGKIRIFDLDTNPPQGSTTAVRDVLHAVGHVVESTATPEALAALVESLIPVCEAVVILAPSAVVAQMEVTHVHHSQFGGVIVRRAPGIW